VKKSVSTKSNTSKKSAKKAVKKATKKVTKKVAKKPAKKVAKKVSKKVLKKAVKKTPAKKATKKVAKKVVKKVSKKPATKKTAVKKVIKKSKPTTKKKEVLQAEVLNQENGFSGKNFLFTGTLTSMQRKEAELRVKDLGGSIISSVDKKLDYLVVGDKPGSKLKAAQKVSSIKVIDEDAFLTMLLNTKDEHRSNSFTTDVYKIEFHVYGYGKENCVAEMTDTQYKYWKAKFADEDCDAKSELSDHLWNFDYDAEAEDTHFGKWYDQDDVLHEEKAYYSDSSVLNVTVYKNGEHVDEITRNVTYKGLEKSFYDEFVPNKKNNKGKGYLYTGAVDRGAYCEGSFELDPGEVFDEKKLSIIVGKVFDQQFVWDICYGDYGILDDEGCQSSTGKGFDVDVYFF